MREMAPSEMMSVQYHFKVLTQRSSQMCVPNSPHSKHLRTQYVISILGQYAKYY